MSRVLKSAFIRFNELERLRARPLFFLSKIALPAAACFSLVFLAGCASSRNGSESLNWEDPAITLAPAPAPVPVPSQAPLITLAPQPAPEPVETWVPLNRWSRENAFPAPARIGPGRLSSYALSTPRGVFAFRPGSQLSYWDGLELRLGFAPQFIEGQPYIHTLDLKKTIHPLLRGDVLPALPASPVIVLDPGHGGSDSGTRSVHGRSAEKDYTLDWARRLQSLLSANGWKVYLTRATDCDMSLSNRVAFAEERKADLFLSLHFNSAAPNQNEAGLETYCLTPAGMPSSLTRGFADDLSLSFPNNNYDSGNLQLALAVHRALLQVNGRRDRGIRHARFPGILRNQQRPAILIEGGYLSNPAEARQIADSAYRQKLAEAVAQGIAQTWGRPLPTELAAQRIAAAAPRADDKGRVTGEATNSETGGGRTAPLAQEVRAP